MAGKRQQLAVSAVGTAPASAQRFVTPPEAMVSQAKPMAARRSIISA
jgi:hypothetical protein